VLALAESGLTSLPGGLGACTQLEVLDIAHNGLTGVPDEVGDLRALQVLYLGDNRLTVVPEPVRRLVVRVLGSKVTAIVTNVPGPRERLTLAGVAVDGVAFWVPQAAAVGVGVSLFSYAGTVRIGVATDAGLVPDAQRLADALDAELAALLGDTPSAGNPGEVPGV
jgi:hypothetical protein